MSNIVKTSIADVLGGLLADAADIKTEADAAKAVLIGMAAQDGSRAFEGDLFRATVSFGNKTKTDYKAMIEALVLNGVVNRDIVNVYVKQYTEVAEGVPTVRCTARKA